MPIIVKISQFEGPLDLLFQLIEKEKLDIAEVTLSKITEEYLSQIDKFKTDKDQLSEFINLASKLLYLKSKALLPSLKNEEEEDDLENLKLQLEEYKKYKQAAKNLMTILEKENRCFTPSNKTNINLDIFEAPTTDAETLKNIYKEVIRRMPKKQDLAKESIKKQITIEEKYNEILKLLDNQKKISISYFFNKAKNRLEIVITLLAILELIKQKIIVAKQKTNFKDCLISKV